MIEKHVEKKRKKKKKEIISKDIQWTMPKTNI